MDIVIVVLIVVVTIGIETIDEVIATIDVTEMIVVEVAAIVAETDHHDEIDNGMIDKEMTDIVDVMTDLIETDIEMIETETIDDMMTDATIVAAIAVTETTDTSKNHVTKIEKTHKLTVTPTLTPS